MDSNVLLVLSTFPEQETARRIGRELVERKLAACVNIGPALESIYRWEGKVESASEVLCIIKTTQGQFGKLQEELCSLHPYDVPEVIALPLADGAGPYLRWVAESCGE